MNVELCGGPMDGECLDIQSHVFFIQKKPDVSIVSLHKEKDNPIIQHPIIGTYKARIKNYKLVSNSDGLIIFDWKGWDK